MRCQTPTDGLAICFSVKNSISVIVICIEKNKYIEINKIHGGFIFDKYSLKINNQYTYNKKQKPRGCLLKVIFRTYFLK